MIRPMKRRLHRNGGSGSTALEALFNQMHAWLRQDDPGELIRIRKASEPIEEEELGVYSAPSLWFMMKHRTVIAVPIARNVIGPDLRRSRAYPWRGSR